MPARPQRKTTSKKPTAKKASAKKASASPPGRKKARATGPATSPAAAIPEGYAIGPYGELIALEDLGLVAGSQGPPAPSRKET